MSIETILAVDKSYDYGNFVTFIYLTRKELNPSENLFEKRRTAIGKMIDILESGKVSYGQAYNLSRNLQMGAHNKDPDLVQIKRLASNIAFVEEENLETVSMEAILAVDKSYGYYNFGNFIFLTRKEQNPNEEVFKKRRTAIGKMIDILESGKVSYSQAFNLSSSLTMGANDEDLDLAQIKRLASNIAFEKRFDYRKNNSE